MTEMREAIIFVGFWRPLPSPDATILNYLIDRDRGWRALPFVGFWRKMPTPSSPDATILNYLLTERGGGVFFVGFWRPTPPFPQTPQYLTILMTE